MKADNIPAARIEIVITETNPETTKAGYSFN